MKTLVNVRPYVGGKILPTTNLSWDGEKIVAVGDQILGDTIDGNNAIVAAGYIEIHSHGGWGKDCMEPTYESIDTIARYHLSTGITTYYPTTLTASIEDTDKAIANIREYAKQGSRGARIQGVHMEGPYLAQKAAGAHPPMFLVDPNEENTKVVWKNKDMVSRITIAPNWKSAPWFTKKASEVGIQVSLGHDDSIDDEIYACIEEGASSVTHLYNCTSKPSRRDNPKKHLGLTEIGMISDDLIAEVIADDRHVPNALFKMIYKIKGVDKIVLVSDSLSVAGLDAKGTYYIGSGDSKQLIKIEDGVAVLPAENTYAGSITPISKMTQNLVKIGFTQEQALQMGTLNQAKLMKLTDRGDLQVGMLADFNLLNDDLSIIDTYLAGEKVDKASLK